MSLACAQRVLQPRVGDDYPNTCVQGTRLGMGVDDADARRRGTSPSKCGTVDINTYSNRSLLTCARLGSTKKRP